MALNENEVLINRRRAIQRMLQVGTSIAGVAAAGGTKSFGQIIPLPYRVESTSFMVTGCQAFGSRCDSL
jgi:hypothetical protein